jgi:hypothetical protein
MMVCPWHMFPSIHVRNMLTSSGCDVLTLSSVSISAAIIVPSIIIAFNLQNIEDYLDKRRETRLARLALRGAGPGSAGPSGARQRGTGLGGGEMPLEALDLEADGRRKQKLLDEEQGRESANISS